MTITTSQELLLQSCFLPNGEHYFKKWIRQFEESPLDYHTKAIIPSLLSHLPIAQISPILGKKMMAYKRQTWLLNSSKWQEIKDILNDFASHGIDYCLLKGAAMVLFYYNDLSYRSEHSDIDVLIKKEHLQKAIDVLKKHHFRTMKIFLWDPNRFEESVYSGGKVLNSQHAITYIKDRLNIDLHWHFVSMVDNFDYYDLEPYMEQKPSMGSVAHFFCPEMQIVHVATHAAIQDTRHSSINSIIDFCYLVNTKNINLHLLKHLCLRFELTAFVKSALENYKFCINEDIYKSYKQVLTSYSSPYVTSLFYSNSAFKRRIAQFYFSLKKNHFNPVHCLIMLKYYFGASSYSALLLHLIKGYLGPVLFKGRLK